MEPSTEKRNKRHDDETLSDPNDKENTDLNSNANVSVFVDVPVFNESSNETPDGAVHTSKAIDSQNKKESLLFSGNYFQIISQCNNGIRARCTTCEKLHSGTKQTTSNFITHLKVRIFFRLFISIDFNQFSFSLET